MTTKEQWKAGILFGGMLVIAVAINYRKSFGDFSPSFATLDPAVIASYLPPTPAVLQPKNNTIPSNVFISTNFEEYTTVAVDGKPLPEWTHTPPSKIMILPLDGKGDGTFEDLIPTGENYLYLFKSGWDFTPTGQSNDFEAASVIKKGDVFYVNPKTGVMRDRGMRIYSVDGEYGKRSLIWQIKTPAQ